MRSLKNTWLYCKLAEIYGEDQLVLKKGSSPPSLSLPPSVHSSSTHRFFPVKDGNELLGWVGIRTSLMDTHSEKLIDTLALNQSIFTLGEQEGEEQVWQMCVQERPRVWLERWERLGYESDTQFGNVYLVADGQRSGNGEAYQTLKKIVENVLEQKTYFLPLRHKTFVWIIPYYDRVQSSLEQTLNGLVDTVASESFIDVTVYQGDPYTMPREIRGLINEDIQRLELALHYDIDNLNHRVLNYETLLYFILLESSPKETLQQMVDKILGPLQNDQESLHTLRTFFRENLNISETAKSLYIHRNSLQYRLEKMTEKTGMDVRRFEDAAKIYLAIQALGMIPKK